MIPMISSRTRSKKPQQLFTLSDESIRALNVVYTVAKRVKKQEQMPNTSSGIVPSEDPQVLDVYKGDDFHLSHTRPSFLSKWNGTSNTLHIPESEYKNMSPMMEVYWEHKSKNMNCVMFIQLGKIEYIVFEDDAILLSKIFSKQLKKFSKFIRCNFWSQEIELVKNQLFQRGIPVLILGEIRDQKFEEENKIIKRQILQVITPSIHLSYQSQKWRDRTMLCIWREKQITGVVCVDTESNKFYLQEFYQKSYDQLCEIRTIINRYRPVEVVIKKGDDEVRKMAKQICHPYVVEVQVRENIDMIAEIEAIVQIPLLKMIKSLKKKNKQSKKLQYSGIISGLYLCFSYLRNLKLEEKIFSQGIFELCSLENSKLNPMFDAQIYENLSVFTLQGEEDSYGKPGTLYHYLNYCVTNSGQKMLKRWIDEPLRSKSHIIDRQKSISFLLRNDRVVCDLHYKLEGFKNLEKRIGDIYHWKQNQKETERYLLTQDINFDKDYDEDKNPAVVRLKQIYHVLDGLQNLQDFLEEFQYFCGESQYLKELCKIHRVNPKKFMASEEKGLPFMKKSILDMKEKFNYDGRSLKPAKGILQTFDKESMIINRIKQKLQQILYEWRSWFNTGKVSYVSVRARNQIQVPILNCDKKHGELVFSSQTSTYIRYVHPEVTELTEELIEHEQLLCQAYQPFLMMIVQEFSSFKLIWDIFIKAISTIDVLISLMKCCRNMKVKCLPHFIRGGYRIKGACHPGLVDIKGEDRFSRNDIKMQNEEKILLLSGPNMGGKSTFLRQSCLLAIMAQIGCYVPASSYDAPVFDQIFCRIGTSDRIIEGKSTFYVQLEETKRILDQATPDSLIVIDQLGRGTSTYDGVALASGILRYLHNQVSGYVLFSTHYYPLIEEFKKQKFVKCAKMGYNFVQEALKFTYKIESGVSERSFANQVATLTGISQKVIKISEKKCAELTIQEEKIRKNNQKIKKLQQMNIFLQQ